MTAETSNARGEWVLVPREIVDRFPEINPSNYDHRDACALNAWGVELVRAVRDATPPPPADARGDVRCDRELIAQMLDAAEAPAFTMEEMDTQARLLREADNAGAEKVGTARALTAAQQKGLRIVEPIRNCATPESREAAMVVLETDAEGNPTIWCDPEIADLVRALNVGGVRTKASCSGHGEKPFGIVSLQDGRELLVLPDWETTRRAERILDAGLSAQQQGQAAALPKLKRTHPSYSREEVQWVFGYNAALDDVMRLNKNTALAQQPAAVGRNPAHAWPAVDRLLIDAYNAGTDGTELDLIAARRKIAAIAQQPAAAPIVGGTKDTSTFSDVEDALDRIEAPARADDGRWLTLPERIAALQQPAAVDEAMAAIRKLARDMKRCSLGGATRSALRYSDDLREYADRLLALAAQHQEPKS